MQFRGEDVELADYAFEFCGEVGVLVFQLFVAFCVVLMGVAEGFELGVCVLDRLSTSITLMFYGDLETVHVQATHESQGQYLPLSRSETASCAGYPLLLAIPRCGLSSHLVGGNGGGVCPYGGNGVHVVYATSLRAS